jgi:hypothetical protein
MKNLVPNKMCLDISTICVIEETESMSYKVSLPFPIRNESIEVVKLLPSSTVKIFPKYKADDSLGVVSPQFIRQFLSSQSTAFRAFED